MSSSIIDDPTSYIVQYSEKTKYSCILLGVSLLLVIIFFVSPFSVSSSSWASWILKLIIIGKTHYRDQGHSWHGFIPRTQIKLLHNSRVCITYRSFRYSYPSFVTSSNGREKRGCGVFPSAAPAPALWIISRKYNRSLTNSSLRIFSKAPVFLSRKIIVRCSYIITTNSFHIVFVPFRSFNMYINFPMLYYNIPIE